ncbi:MAG: type II toxin-antitoxin system ParD family antitoxin [Gammaproteobacteria bacterium]|nr:type II toxin-antitoxin system ParD family antitoxin [Gammaproteobacteria bacterium]MDP2348433.1 type II toxin-antitoxin system ParD family antitoxin [Gammaproteobacteria bacterium]
MHISLTPELESRVKAKVEPGLYNNASEVIREALRFMETHEEWVNEIKLARLREQLRMGAEQLARGEGIAIRSKEALARLFDEIMSKDASDVATFPPRVTGSTDDS